MLLFALLSVKHYGSWRGYQIVADIPFAAYLGKCERAGVSTILMFTLSEFSAIGKTINRAGPGLHIMHACAKSTGNVNTNSIWNQNDSCFSLV